MGIAAMLFLPAICFSHALSPQECAEGGDFIRNAALARDNGMTEEQFMSRIEEDLEVIKAFPPELRWFVQDDNDAQLLLTAASSVFREPKQAAVHRLEFLIACMNRAGNDAQRTVPDASGAPSNAI
ncbi:hypothetical protein ACFQUU_10715 [Herbaspirillum sp. GCM10030257]|uniref:hypothetical protein n=1 Tax=Herbaspirillum sp. GCM10030257 TaxID=3273393 RepID=UPI003622F6D3